MRDLRRRLRSATAARAEESGGGVRRRLLLGRIPRAAHPSAALWNSPLALRRDAKEIKTREELRGFLFEPRHSDGNAKI